MIEELPVKIVCYDLLEFNYNDIRKKSIEERKKLLNDLILDTDKLMISETLQACNWLEYKAQREHSREKGVEGFMLKRKGSEYKSGRVKGDWFKWKVEPYTVDAVLIYAQAGHGRRASLYTDYTFAVKNGDEFLPFAKAYSGLTDDEFRQVDRFIKTNTIEKFGPVRSVKTELVFEIAFESIRKSPRHKSGIAVRFPRISRWRKDKTVVDIDTLDTLKSMIND